MNILSNCTLCPRNCGVDRLSGKLGFCKSGIKLKLARVSLHHFEEPCLSGTKGSGTVFFSHCTLGCVFCQNHEISQEGFGKEVSVERLSEIFIELQTLGAHNINLVTPTHYVPQIIESLKKAKSEGLTLPIVYNTGGYENLNTIKMLENYIDVFVPDLKYYDDKFAFKYSNVRNYFINSSKAIEEMYRQVGPAVLNKEGLISKGVLIRHLMLPGLLFDSKKIIDYVSATFNNNVYLSIMNQYTPMHYSHLFPEINKPLNSKHYDALIDYAIGQGITNGFIQDLGTASEEFIPDFDLSGI